MAEQWKVVGDFVDFCNCSVPCPCTFAQPPTEGECYGVIGWRVRSGSYGDVPLDGMSVAGVARFVRNIWEPETKAKGGFIIDESADEAQRGALATIFGGQAGGWPGLFAENFDEVLGMEFAPIDLEIENDLKTWRIDIPGLATGSTV